MVEEVEAEEAQTREEEPEGAEEEEAVVQMEPVKWRWVPLETDLSPSIREG